MRFDDLCRLGASKRFDNGGLPDPLQSKAPLTLVALVPFEKHQTDDCADKTDQTEDRDGDISIIHPPNLLAAYNYVNSWPKRNCQLLATDRPLSLIFAIRLHVSACLSSFSAEPPIDNKFSTNLREKQ